MDRAALRVRANRIAEQIRNGASYDEVAGAEGLSYRAVAGIARRHGLACTRVSMTDRTFVIMAALINTDATCMEIAKANGVTRQWVSDLYRRANAAGIPVRRRLQSFH